jgi:hypothetical protein
MGGQGRGCHDHWWRPPRKAVVEDCYSIDANYWTREGILKHGVWHSGSVTWTSYGGPGFIVHFEASTLHPAHLSVRLQYSWVWTATQRQGSADYRVRLTTTRSFKGRRWWFLCTLLVNGAPLQRPGGQAVPAVSTPDGRSRWQGGFTLSYTGTIFCRFFRQNRTGGQHFYV